MCLGFYVSRSIIPRAEVVEPDFAYATSGKLVDVEPVESVH